MKKISVFSKEINALALIFIIIILIGWMIILVTGVTIDGTMHFIFLLSLILLSLAIRRIEFSKDDVCIYYCNILRRRIAADRMTSIQFAIDSGKIMLILCFDGHRPYNDIGITLGSFFWTWKVDYVYVSEDKCDECIEKLTELYGEVTLCGSYKKYKARKKKK